MACENANQLAPPEGVLYRFAINATRVLGAPARCPTCIERAKRLASAEQRAQEMRRRVQADARELRSGLQKIVVLSDEAARAVVERWRNQGKVRVNPLPGAQQAIEREAHRLAKLGFVPAWTDNWVLSCDLPGRIGTVTWNVWPLPGRVSTAVTVAIVQAKPDATLLASCVVAHLRRHGVCVRADWPNQLAVVSTTRRLECR